MSQPDLWGWSTATLSIAFWGWEDSAGLAGRDPASFVHSERYSRVSFGNPLNIAPSCAVAAFKSVRSVQAPAVAGHHGKPPSLSCHLSTDSIVYQCQSFSTQAGWNAEKVLHGGGLFHASVARIAADPCVLNDLYVPRISM